MEKSSSKASIDDLLHGLAGSFAALISAILLFPIDNIKIRQQIEAKRQDETNKNLKSMKEFSKEIYSNEGLRGFYKGITPVLIGNYISNFTYFFWYNIFKGQIGVIDKEIMSVYQYAFCAFLAGMITSVVTNPFWVVQTKMTVSQKDITFIEAIVQIVKDEGILKLFKGLTTSVILVLNPIINFIMYEELKYTLSKITDNGQMLSVIYFISGGISKFCATVLTYPQQIMRTHSHLVKHGYLQMIKEVYYAKGIFGFYAGLQAKLFQTVLNQAFLLMFYEKIFLWQKFFLVGEWNFSVEQGGLFVKLFVIIIICIYISWAVHTKHSLMNLMPLIVLAGVLMNIGGDVFMLFEGNRYQLLSLFTFTTAHLSYMFSLLYSLSNKSNRIMWSYIIFGVFVIYILTMHHDIDDFSNGFGLKDVVGNFVITTLVVFTIQKFGRTSNKSFLLMTLGAALFLVSASLSWITREINVFSNASIFIIIILYYVMQAALMIMTMRRMYSKQKHTDNADDQTEPQTPITPAYKPKSLKNNLRLFKNNKNLLDSKNIEDMLNSTNDLGEKEIDSDQ